MRRMRKKGNKYGEKVGGREIYTKEDIRIKEQRNKE